MEDNPKTRRESKKDQRQKAKGKHVYSSRHVRKVVTDIKNNNNNNKKK